MTVLGRFLRRVLKPFYRRSSRRTVPHWTIDKETLLRIDCCEQAVVYAAELCSFPCQGTTKVPQYNRLKDPTSLEWQSTESLSYSTASRSSSLRTLYTSEASLPPSSSPELSSSSSIWDESPMESTTEDIPSSAVREDMQTQALALHFIDTNAHNTGAGLLTSDKSYFLAHDTQLVEVAVLIDDVFLTDFEELGYANSRVEHTEDCPACQSTSTRLGVCSSAHEDPGRSTSPANSNISRLSLPTSSTNTSFHVFGGTGDFCRNSVADEANSDMELTQCKPCPPIYRRGQRQPNNECVHLLVLHTTPGGTQGTKETKRKSSPNAQKPPVLLHDIKPG
ncbi:hypothetical protein AAHC03_017016 [Spirometra sp. Aus1]